MTIILERHTIPDKGKLDISLNISTEIKISAEEARRKVNGFVISNISNLMMGDRQVELVIRERVYWRVIVHHTLPGFGAIGKVGEIDVDVETGKVEEPSVEKVEEMYRRAKALASSYPSPFHLFTSSRSHQSAL